MWHLASLLPLLSRHLRDDHMSSELLGWAAGCLTHSLHSVHLKNWGNDLPELLWGPKNYRLKLLWEARNTYNYEFCSQWPMLFLSNKGCWDAPVSGFSLLSGHALLTPFHFKGLPESWRQGEHLQCRPFPSLVPKSCRADSGELRLLHPLQHRWVSSWEAWALPAEYGGSACMLSRAKVSLGSQLCQPSAEAVTCSICATAPNKIK